MCMVMWIVMGVMSSAAVVWTVTGGDGGGVEWGATRMWLSLYGLICVVLTVMQMLRAMAVVTMVRDGDHDGDVVVVVGDGGVAGDDGGDGGVTVGAFG